MKIPYKTKRDYWDLFMAIMWAFFAFTSKVRDDEGWLKYVPIILAVFLFLYFIFDKKTYYLKLENGILKQSRLFGKKMKLSEIKQIEKMASIYILKTNNAEFKINTKLIPAEILNELNTELEKINIK